jgi:hypothetical protein
MVEDKKKTTINVNRFIMLLKQTELIPMEDIYKVKNTLMRMNKGQRLTLKQRQLYEEVATKASVDPMSNSFVLLNQTKTKLNQMKAARELEQQKETA